MEKNFKLDDPDYYSMRFGLIVLQSDETIEQEIRSTLDESVAIYHSRIPCDQSVNNENLAKMEMIYQLQCTFSHKLTLTVLDMHVPQVPR